MTKQLILSNFKPIALANAIEQEKINTYFTFLYLNYFEKEQKKLTTAHSEDSFSYDFIENQIQKYAVKPKDIHKRQILLLEDISGFLDNITKTSLLSEYPLPAYLKEDQSSSKGPKIGNRMQWFNQKMIEVFTQFYKNTPNAPENLVHVSCSGYASPSVAQKAVIDRAWAKTKVTHSYQMGCYGAFPAIRTARGLMHTSNTTGRTDIIHTEFLSTHLDLTEFSASNVMISSLFADGFIGYSIYEEERFLQDDSITDTSGLRIIADHEVIIPDSLEDMSWDIGEHNFLMTLSKRVPVFIRKNIKAFITELCDKAAIDFEKEKYNMLFAIHPGGPKIIDYIIDELDLFKPQARWSYEILKNHGNMSSATVPHIFDAMIKDPEVKPGTKIIAMAFGPGLTATALVVEKI